MVPIGVRQESGGSHQFPHLPLWLPVIRVACMLPCLPTWKLSLFTWKSPNPPRRQMEPPDLSFDFDFLDVQPATGRSIFFIMQHSY